MIKKSNIRIQITLSQKQADWLTKNAKRLNITRSRLIKFLMDKNMAKWMSYLPKEQFEWMVKICKTPWIDLDENKE